jgi:hypothetical protein
MRRVYIISPAPSIAADLLAGESVGLGWNFEQINPAQALFDRLLAVLHQDLMAQQTVALDLPR